MKKRFARSILMGMDIVRRIDVLYGTQKQIYHAVHYSMRVVLYVILLPT